MGKKYGKMYQEIIETEDEIKTGFFTKLGYFIALAVISMIIGMFSTLFGWIVFLLGTLIVWNM